MKYCIIKILHSGITFEMPIILLENYANSFLKIKSKYDKFKKLGKGTLEDILKHEMIYPFKDKFDSHDFIFEYVGLTHHRYREDGTLEHYLQEAIECWWITRNRGITLRKIIINRIKSNSSSKIVVTTVPKVVIDFRTETQEDETHTRKLSQ